jgi:hypothetical protein
VKITMRSKSAGYSQQMVNETPTSHKWIKLIVAVWAVRMGMVGIGMMIPIVVGLIASVPRSKPLFVPDTIIEMQTWAHPTPEKVKLLTKGAVPVVMQGATLPQQHSYELLLRAWLPETLESVKESSSPNFTYFDVSSPWASSFSKGAATTHNQSLSYSYTSMKTTDFLKVIGMEAAAAAADLEVGAAFTAERRHLYTSIALGDDRPSQSPLLQSIAPYMALYDEHHASEHKRVSRAFLWMASRDAYVTPHYDIDHNFLLQLSGTKRVVLTTPAGYDLFRPGSSLSPYWRQSQGPTTAAAAGAQGPGPSMSSMQNIKDAISRCYAQPLDRGRDRDESGNETVAVTAAAGSDGGALCVTGYNHSYALFHPTSIISWEVLLTPGDVLYIPPGYFHSVLYTSPASHSVNLFLNSLVYVH